MCVESIPLFAFLDGALDGWPEMGKSAVFSTEEGGKDGLAVEIEDGVMDETAINGEESEEIGDDRRERQEENVSDRIAQLF